MKRLYFLLISLFVIGCSDSSLGPQEDCFCGLDISSNLPQNGGMYELEYDSSLAQTYGQKTLTVRYYCRDRKLETS